MIIAPLQELIDDGAQLISRLRGRRDTSDHDHDRESTTPPGNPNP